MNHIRFLQGLCKVLSHAPTFSVCFATTGRRCWHRLAGHMNLANQPVDKRKGEQKQTAVCVNLLMKTGPGFGLLRVFLLYLLGYFRSPLHSDLEGLGRARELLLELRLDRGKLFMIASEVLWNI